MPRLPKYPRSHTIIYATDINLIIGPNLGSAYRLLRKIRQHYGKPPKSEVTVDEFCKYTKLSKYEIQPIIDSIRRKEDLAIYSRMKNPPRHVLADIDLPDEDWYIHYN